MPAPPNPFAEFVERLRRQRVALDAQDWTPPEPPDEPETRDTFRLKPLTMSSLAPLPPPISLEELRARLPVRLHDYLDGPSRAALLVRTPPGSGKTHSTVAVAQFLARRGKRGLWCAGRHSMFADLENFDHFDPALWYHWRGLQGQIDDEPACRYAAGQKRWGELGYGTMELCRQLCGRLRDNWIRLCPYRQQARRKEALVFGQHQHLVSGLALADYDFVVVDELPLNAFIEDRTIPVAGLNVGAVGPLASLIQNLTLLCGEAPANGRISGRRLFDLLGDLLDDVFAQVEVGAGLAPDVPAVWDESTVFRAPYWYVYDFLEIAAAEHRAWREGWPVWNERVWLTQRGLHLLGRGRLWEKLPDKVVVLDATAQPALYRLLFEREVETFEHEIARRGRVYQVAGRLNGRQGALEGDELSRAGRELVDVARHLMRDKRRPGIICWKALAPHFRQVVAPERVLTFGALRGTNILEDCDALVIAGTFQPDGSKMLDLAVALSDRLRPFWELDERGMRQPLRRFGDREYRLSAEGLRRAREQFGPQTQGVARRIAYYADETLDAVHRQLREAELLQALHRARITLHDAEVWLLTSTPLQEEPLDGLWDDPPLGPAGINWRVWLRLEPWLEEQWQQGNAVTYESLAGAVQVSENWVRRNHWLDAIVAHLPDKWQSSRIESSRRGKPRMSAFPLKTSAQYS